MVVMTVVALAVKSVDEKDVQLVGETVLTSVGRSVASMASLWAGESVGW